MRWTAGVAGVLAALALGTGPALAESIPQVWLQPADAPGASPAGEVRVGCEPLTIWASGDLAGEGVWAALPLAAAPDSGAHTLIGGWRYAGGSRAAQVADVGALAPGRYRLVLYGALARERVVTVDCPRPPAPVYAPVVQPLVASGAVPPPTDPSATVQLVAVHSEASTGPASPVVLVLLAGLLMSLLLIGWSFARR